MSYINEALKKAQEMKDSNNPGFNMPGISNFRRSRASARILIYSLSAIILVAVLFSIRMWWVGSSQDTRNQATVNNAEPSEVKTGDNESTGKELYHKASSLYKSGRTEEAKKLYEAVLGLDPGFIEALNNLSIIYIHDRKFDAAKELLEKAVRLKPAYVESYYNLACLYAINGNIEKGVEYLEKAISLDRSVREWARSDTDLKNLQRSNTFNKLLSD
jgi:tetratricopeptide (TPR) repeat protein